jgi:LysR family glycine cleavage system transcriptional activator
MTFRRPPRQFGVKMSYRLPPLNGLRSFEAAARHLSFTRAADELGVTPGAVSQQVKSLEGALGITLFRRLPRSLILTEEGEAYLPAITSAFDLISRATESSAPALRGRKLRLGIAPRLMKTTAPAARKLRQAAIGNDVVALKLTDDLAELLNGKLDMLLRTAGGSRAADASWPCRLPRTSPAAQAAAGGDCGVTVPVRGQHARRATEPEL